MTETVTVVIASYNYGMFAAQAIDSVLSQTSLPDDIIYVDDCSDEDGIGCYIAEKFGIKVIGREKNLGIVDNYNDVLFNHIKTDKVMFLAADDYLRNDALEKMLKEGKYFDIISSDIMLVGSEAKKCPQSKKTEFINGNYIWRFNSPKNQRELQNKIMRTNFIHGSSIYDVKLAKEVGGYEKVGKNTVHKLQEDWGLWRKMINNGADHYHVSEPLLNYRKWKFNWNGVY